ncbi:MAG TPA: hypothetical protein VL094_05930 [Sphingomonadaceae bacterium]|nr:hypothetical protein [Sphingomonadaceae bacterium]
MNSEPKPFASLGPTLLARKGAARPAMRSQFQTFGAYERHISAQIEDGQIEDLGWNDMGPEGGNENEAPRQAEVLALTPAPPSPSAPIGSEANEESAPEAGTAIPDEADQVPELPQVLRQQEEVARKIAQPAVQPAPRRAVRSAAERRSALDDGRRAAFTLRVDAERHLKLRLACTIRNLSAQQVVTEALDKLLSGIPELDSLTAQLKRK